MSETEATVLVVDDDQDVRLSVERALRLSGFRVTGAADGAAALRSVGEQPPDVIVLDMNMPVMDGTGVVTALRAMGNDVPICVLSARSSVDERIAGLEAGADDYMVKPFVLEELVARLRALLRRRPDRPQSEDAIDLGSVEIDLPGRRVFRDGHEVTLTKREFELLATLANNRGVVLSRARLLELVWGYDFDVETNVVDVFVGYLRRKLSAGDSDFIHTVRGVGYVIR